METLINELKERIIDRLNLLEIDPNDILPDDALFNDGLGLDSIDALELVVMLENDYGIKVGDVSVIQPHFKSLNTLALFIKESSESKNAVA